VDDTTAGPDSSGRDDEFGDAAEESRAPERGRLSTLPPEAGRPIGPPPAEPGSRLRTGMPVPGAAAYPLEPAAPPDTGQWRPADIAMAGRSTAHRGGERPRRSPLTAVFVGLIAGVLGAAVTVASLAVGGVFNRPNTIVREVPVPGSPPQIIVDGTATSPAAAVAQKVVPSIVSVEVASDNGNDTFSAFASGSGVVLSRDGLIVTNHHVIEDADLAQVILQNGAIYDARVVGSDPVTDLAVLQVEQATLMAIELGSTTSLGIGDQAIAVGNPLGLPGGASVTVGVVSAFDREVVVGPAQTLYGMLQTDAPITKGSSGGALVDGAGRLIGITTAIGVTDAGAEGVGFAIPVELVTRITDELIETGTVRHAFLGVRLQDFFVQSNGATVPAGAVIVEFVTPSGARDAGLEQDDRLTLINGAPVLTGDDVVNELRKFRVGDTVVFEVVRGETTFTADVILGERPEDP
jgi:S1-C subfamily serine protease